MWKYLSIILSFSLLILGIFYLIEKKSHQSDVIKLSNEVSKFQGIVQETKTAYSRQAVDLENLKVENVELQKIIKEKDETIFAVSQIALKLKDKAFEDKNVKVIVVDKDGNPTNSPASCEDCLKNVRLKVEFDQKDNVLRVHGYTLTNPGYASVNVDWIRPLKLNLALTKKDNKFKIYVDSGSDVVPTDLVLKVDSSVIDYSWYEKLSVFGSLSAGRGVVTNAGFGYQILQNVNIGPVMSIFYDTQLFRKMYGVNVLWFPFR